MANKETMKTKTSENLRNILFGLSNLFLAIVLVGGGLLVLKTIK